ncbi:hypothetical protein Tco_0432215 [Tanacetum coccineum]
MLKRCEDTNLSLNWEKSHFMVRWHCSRDLKISKYRNPWIYCFKVIVPHGLRFCKLTCGNSLSREWDILNKNKFFKDVKHYFWDDPFLDLWGHYGARSTTARIYYSIKDSFGPKFYKDANDCAHPMVDFCQSQGKITQRDRDAKKLHPSLSKFFNFWGHDFLWGRSRLQEGTSTYCAIDYLSKWVEAKAATHQ